MYRVHFLPDDKTISVPQGTPLSMAAAELGLAIRNDCGGCGTCKKCVVLVDGIEKLACQTVIEKDCEITIPEASRGIDDSGIVIQEKSFLESGTEFGVEKRSSKYRFGVALDIGTTTLAAELFEWSEAGSARFLGVVSRMNPQRNYGDDLISRIQRVIEEPAFLSTMQRLVVDAVGEMLEELAAKACQIGVACSCSEIAVLSVAGNTAMEYFFLGIDPSPLGFAPYHAPISEFAPCRGHDIGLSAAPDCEIETLPIFGGFVGGDIVAGVLVTQNNINKEPDAQAYSPKLPGYQAEATTPCRFLIDIGTNGELVLWHDGKLYTAATAAGPAFEGGRIEFGMLAAPGAVEKVKLREDGSVEVATIGNRPAMGICGSGLIDVAAELLNFGLIEPSGRFSVKADSPFLSRWKMHDGKPAFELVVAEDSGRRESILLTQKDVRQLQLASGAIRAGVRLLLREHGLSPENIMTFYVAGGFGSFIRPESARRIGLLPSEMDFERIQFCGNTSLAGARMALLDSRCRTEALRLSRSAHSVELASLNDFANVFAECMIFNE